MHYPSLTELAANIRCAHKAVREASANALAAAMNAGDNLIEAKKQSPAGGWVRWVETNCDGMPASTARLYKQLAEHRAEIEREREKFPDLSLRAARRLITKSPEPKEKESEEAEPEPTAAEILIETWKQANDADRTTFLEQIDIDDFIKAMPADWRNGITARLRGNALAKLPAKLREKFRPKVIHSTVHH